LVEALPPDGVAVLNADDHRVAAMGRLTGARTITFGQAVGADVRVGAIELDRLARPSFELTTPWGTEAVRLAVSGRHMAFNAAAAIACVGVAGGDVSAGVAALAEVHLTAMRMQIEHTAGGGLIVNDCYNANPTSMRAALDALAAIPATRRIALLGLMAEIADAGSEHRAIRDYAAELGIEVIAVGTDLYGMAATPDPVAAVGELLGGQALLVKGSRVVGLERLVAALRH
ncbi:MAG: cyanophycin synthetase, partial [Ilumatobacteraceae bacterium]